jgi:hypothetical protein
VQKKLYTLYQGTEGVFFCSSWVHLSTIKKCHINKISASVHTNAIDLHDTIVYCCINIVPELMYLQMHSNSYKLFSSTHTLQQFTLLRYNKYNLFKVCTMASLRYNKYNIYRSLQLTRVNSANVLDEGLGIVGRGRRMNSKVKIRQTRRGLMCIENKRSTQLAQSQSIPGRSLLAPLYRWPGFEELVGFNTNYNVCIRCHLVFRLYLCLDLSNGSQGY